MGKKYFTIAAILFLAAACNKPQPANNPPSQNPPATSTPADITAGWNSYTSPDKDGFSIKYPRDLGFDTNIEHVRGLAYIPVCDENMVTCVYISRDKYPGTNFEGAGVSINIYQDLNTEAKCYNFKVATNAAQNQTADASINGVVFKSATGGDAGLGHSEQVQVYRNFHNNMCYEIAVHVGQTNIGNYPEGTVQPFNSNNIWQKLQAVVGTFVFAGQAQAKLQVCPEGWTEDDMPGPASTTPEQRQSYILNGQRRELSEFDAAWVQAHCNLKLEHVF